MKKNFSVYVKIARHKLVSHTPLTLKILVTMLETPLTNWSSEVILTMQVYLPVSVMLIGEKLMNLSVEWASFPLGPVKVT